MRHLVCLALLALSVPSFSSRMESGPGRQALDAGNQTVEGLGISGLIHDAAKKTGFVIGHEDETDYATEHLRQVPLYEAEDAWHLLSTIIEKDPNHVIRQTASGNFEIAPQSSAALPSEVTIDSPTLHDGKLTDVWRILNHQSSIDEWLENNNCTLFNDVIAMNAKGDHSKIEIQAGKVHLRDFLDRTAAQIQGVRTWEIIRWRSEGRCYVTLSLG